MRLRIPLISSVIIYFRLYWGYTGRKILLLTALSLLTGITEGFGIALFLPVLKATDLTAKSPDKVSLFFSNLFSLLGIAPNLLTVCVVIVIVFLMKGIIQFGEEAYKGYLTARLTHDIRNQGVSRLGAVTYHYYINCSTGFLSNLITMESSRAVASFMRYCNVLIKMITIAVFVCFSFWVSWQFTIITLLFGSLVLYLLKYISTITRTYSLQTSREYAALHSMLIQSIHAFKYLKATHAFSTLQKKLQMTIQTLAGLQFKSSLGGGVLTALTEPLVVFFVVGILLYQALIAGQHVAPVLLSIMFFYRITQNILALQREWQTFCSYIGGIETVTRATREIEQNREESGSVPFTGFSGSVVCERISFSYSDKPVLQDITCSITKNTTVAFVGESGVGKTTLVDILTGLLPPREGRVTIDGVPLHQISMPAWRQRIGYVTQDPVLFNDTIASNISLWISDPAEPDVQQEKIHRAARQAYCDSFIRRLPDTYQTIIGDRGIKLSGGQRQRLAIARELFKEPDLLILDEATSALDSESELSIQKSIAALKGKLTVILIAHRLSTIRHADYIYVLSTGRIIEEGTFSQLLAAEGSTFRRMCELQNIHA